VRLVAPEEWSATVEAAAQDGYRFFDWLGAEDLIGRKDALLVVLALRRLDRPADVLLLSTELDRTAPQLDSIRGHFAGAAWPEREAAELFGIEFRGGQPGRLLLAAGFTGAPLRKNEVLAARTGLTWPGTKEPGEGSVGPEQVGGRAPTGSGSGPRRRLVPPGVPDPAVWGDREVAAPDPDPTEVAESAGGGRSRRRHVDSRGDTPRAPRRGS
jgi:NADH-quinone oxidoreductase subunit C